MLAFGALLLVLVFCAERWHSIARLAALNMPGGVPAHRPRRTRSRQQTQGLRAAPRSAGTDVAIVADLLEELLVSGTSLTGALSALGRYGAWSHLTVIAKHLEGGVAWHRAWGGVPPVWQELATALETSWRSGAAPSAQLRVLARAQREREKKMRAAAAGRLGVWLLLPLGLCYLPAFVLVAVVPLLVGLAGTFFG